MVKIRINELARELEVKPNVILDMLPELGVTEKKTHSSSVDEPVAIEIKRRLTEESNGSRDSAGSGGSSKTETAPEHVADASPSAELSQAPSAPRHEPVAEAPQAAAQEVPTEVAPPPAPRAAPLRPPLASGPGSAHVPHVPERPIAPPVAPRGIPIPARPAPPAPRPGQILSGPRQPLPGSDTRVSHEAVGHRPAAGHLPGHAQASSPGIVPSMPAPPRPSPRPAAPPAATIVPGTPMGGGSPLRPPAKPNLAGQPAARPIVPPRPDLVAKLTRPPGAASPGAPRPGMPTRPASPVPGQPI